MKVQRCLAGVACAVTFVLVGAAAGSAAEKKAQPAPATKKAQPAAAEKKAQSAESPRIPTSQLPDPVAKVNGVAITAGDLEKAINAFNRSPNAAQVPPGKEKEVQQFLLNQLISAELMYQLASPTPIVNLDQKINESVGELKKRFSSEDEYAKVLQAQGLTEKDLRELIRRNLIIENHVELEIVPKHKVGDAEVKEFYDKNPETFTQPEQARASHILVTVDAKASEADKKAARAKIDGLLKQVKEGADFAKLAQENSSCPSSKQGGDLGYFSKGQMVKPFEDAAWALKPGEVSGVVETQFGFHIIKLAEKRPSSKVAFDDDLKKRIAETLQRRKVGEAVEAAVQGARAKAAIEVFLK